MVREKRTLPITRAKQTKRTRGSHVADSLVELDVRNVAAQLWVLEAGNFLALDPWRVPRPDTVTASIGYSQRSTRAVPQLPKTGQQTKEKRQNNCRRDMDNKPRMFFSGSLCLLTVALSVSLSVSVGHVRVAMVHRLAP